MWEIYFHLISDFFAHHKPHFQTFDVIWMHWKAHLFRHFRLYQTFSHKCSNTPDFCKIWPKLRAQFGGKCGHEWRSVKNMRFLCALLADYAIPLTSFSFTYLGPLSLQLPMEETPNDQYSPLASYGKAIQRRIPSAYDTTQLKFEVRGHLSSQGLD